MRSKQIAGAFVAGLTMLAVVPAALAQQPLFPVVDVNRDTVPAGTPAAFEKAFPAAQRNSAKVEVQENAYEFVPLTLIPLGEDKTALISTGANECTGQACAGLNSVHYLSGPERADYSVTGEWLDVGMTGVVGNPASRWGWTDAIADVPVLYTQGGGVWQGYACDKAVLTALAADGPTEIAVIPIGYSNGGAVEDGVINLDGQITAAEKGKSFTVTYTGTDSFSETYVRQADGKYALQGATKVPSC
ncbi:hypothetical protein GRI97_12120 [Altererythrobacter xixiisoli]|uniref:Lipoprotein n=1 Tax=Croceibacterium xixiisoli TaxID=1476466 RepID=A0A6I4TU56_9SPHN|nr:hypothetical protein [Croceibacterium xixiisoli]